MIVLAFVQVTIAIAIANPAHAVPAEGHQLMMAAPSYHAISAGKEIALAGGNVVDVAVAMAITLSVTTPYYASLGGGGFALVKVGDQPVAALDFRETAPAATSPTYFSKLGENASRQGGTAVAVPGIPAGLWELHQKYGHLPWKKLFAKAERLAESGFRVSGEWARQTANKKSDMNDSGRKHFFKPELQTYLPGEEFKQPALLKALELYKSNGAKGFYEGKVASDIIHAVSQGGGAMTLKDLRDYKVRWLKPLETDFADHHIYLMPPPSSGGVVIKTALALTEKLHVTEKRPLSAEEYHLLGEIDSRSFRGRLLLGDPDFHTNPLKFLFSQAQFDFLLKSIKQAKATTIPALAEDKANESDNTTHFSVLDKDGNSVAMTLTLNGDYGSGIVTDNFGIALNDEMDDFTTKPGSPNMFSLYQGEGNSVQPGKRPLSSMSPTLVEKNGKIVMSLGAPGGPRIISAVFQALYRTLGRGLNADMAIQTPRIHHQFMPNVLFIDRDRVSPEVLDRLKKMGHEIKETPIARVYMVKTNEQGNLEAAFDSRGEGAAGGY
jgi:gamma-glutamyltranspeptidase/glutathione hydrolase